MPTSYFLLLRREVEGNLSLDEAESRFSAYFVARLVHRVSGARQDSAESVRVRPGQAEPWVSLAIGKEPQFVYYPHSQFVTDTVTTHQRGQKASCAQWTLPLLRNKAAFLRHRGEMLSSKVGRVSASRRCQALRMPTTNQSRTQTGVRNSCPMPLQRHLAQQRNRIRPQGRQHHLSAQVTTHRTSRLRDPRLRTSRRFVSAVGICFLPIATLGWGSARLSGGLGANSITKPTPR